MKTIILWSFILLCTVTSAQTERKGIIPFDSVAKKYSYLKIIAVPGKSATELYGTGRKWLINKYHDDKFLIDEKDARLADLGSFQVSVVLDAGMVKMPFNWVVIYDFITWYKDNKCRLEITSIKLSGNSEGTTNETSIEAYEQSIESGYRGKKKNMQKYLYDLFKEIDMNIQKTVTDFEGTITGTKKSDEW